MKSLGRYGFIAVGIPNLLGFAMVALMGPIFLGKVARRNPTAALATADVFSGLATVFAGVLIALVLRVEVTVLLPMVSAIWFAIHFTRLNRFGEFLRASGGIACGWLIYEMLPRI
jgi:hypothetical protein